MKKCWFCVFLIALLVCSASSALALASLQVDRDGYAPGQYIGVSYTGVTQAEADNQAWIAIAPAGSAANSYLSWSYVQAGNGILWLSVPDQAGSYEVRYFRGYSANEENLADGQRIPFAVAGEKPSDDRARYPVRNDFDWGLLTFSPGRGSWAGVYETNFKTLTLRQTGSAVTGEYPEWDNGRVDGYAEDGIFYGYWYESPSYAPPGDAGQLVCALYPDGSGFQGWWRYGNSGSWRDWSAGTLVFPEETDAPSAGDNLLVNGDASQGLWGWNDPDGIWITRTEYEGQVTAYDGAFFMPSAFRTAYGDRTRIWQDVSVSGLEGAETELSAMVRTWDTNNTDETLLVVEYFSANGNLLGQAEVTSANDPSWHRIGVKSTVPAGAVTARLSLYAVYWYGSECDSYFDDVSFSVSGGAAKRAARRSAYERIEGEDWDDTLGVSVASEGGGNAGYIDDGDWTAYYGLDFGRAASTFAVNASSSNQGGIIEIRLDAPEGPLAGDCEVTSTGGWDSWKTFRCPVEGASGVHDVYLVYRGGSGYLLDVNYFWFEPAGAFSSDAEAEIRQAEQRGIIPDCLLGADMSEYIRATEFAALGVRLFEEFWQTQELPETTPYADVPGHPLQTEIEKAYGLGFFKYIRATELEENGLSRQMMAQMLCALIKAFDEDNWTFETNSQFPLVYDMPRPFADDADIFRSSRDSVYYLTSLGIMGSVEDDRFYPSSAATREQAIVAVNRIWTLEQGYDEQYDDWDAEGEDFLFDLMMDGASLEEDATQAWSGGAAEDHSLTVAQDALAAGAALTAQPASLAGLSSKGQAFSAVEITGSGYDGAFFGSDVQLTLSVPGALEGDLGRYLFASYDEQTGITQYFWPDGYDRQTGAITLNLPHLSPWWGTKMSQEEEIDAFLNEYSTRLAIAQGQTRQAASELEPYVRAKAQALGLTRQATEDLVQSAVNYLGGRFQGEYKDTIETSTKAITAVTRGVMDNDTESMRMGLEDAVNGAIMHGWDELQFGKRIDKVLGSEFAGDTVGKLVGSTNGVVRMAGYLAEGDVRSAAEELGGVLQGVHPAAELVTKGARFLATAGDTAFTYWKANQIEALYQVYKHGAQGLFGNYVFPRDRQSFLTFLNDSSGFTLAKGVKRFYDMDKIGEVCERYGWDFKSYSEMPERYRNIFEKRAEDGLMAYFETRLAQEAEAEKIKARERECVEEMLNPYYGVLYSGNFAHFFGEDNGQFNLTARMERLVKVRQFISQYVNENELNRAAGYNYGTLLNEWISLASQYGKADAIRKFCQYLQDLGFLREGMESEAQRTLEEQLELLKGKWEIHYTLQQGYRTGESGVKSHDIYDGYLGKNPYGTGRAELDEAGDLVIIYTYNSGSVTRLKYHFIDENHVQQTNLHDGRTQTLTRTGADSN